MQRCFADLPPHFGPDFNDTWTTADWCDVLPGYSSLPEKFRYSLKFLLASVVHNEAWLRTTKFAPVIVNTALFTSGKLDRLKAHLHTGNFRNEVTGMRATGIPTHLMLDVGIRELQVEVGTLKAAIETAAERTPEKVKDCILQNMQIDGVVPLTRDDVNMLVSDLKRDLVDEMRKLTVAPGPAQEQPAEAEAGMQFTGGILRDGFRWWMWGGRFHMIPKDFVFPVLNCAQLFPLWVRGNAAELIRPYRYIVGKDLKCSSDSQTTVRWKSYLSKARTVMKVLLAKSGKTWTELENMTAEARDEAFKKAYDELLKVCYPENEAERKSRRSAEVTYLRLYDVVPKAEKPPKQRNADDDEMDQN